MSWKAPYGYRYVPRQVDERGRWEIDENEAPIVRRLFGWIADEGISLREATKRLNGSSFKPRCGGDIWCTSSVRSIVTNDAYTGVSYYNRRRFVESDRTDGMFLQKPQDPMRRSAEGGTATWRTGSPISTPSSAPAASILTGSSSSSSGPRPPSPRSCSAAAC